MIVITIEVSPNLELMMQEFPGVPIRLLERLLHDAMDQFGNVLVGEIRKVLEPRRFSGRLAQAFGYRVKELGILKPETRSIPDYLQVGLFEEVGAIPPEEGRPPRDYFRFHEMGSGPHTRPWGNISARRIIFWAKARGFQPLPWKRGGRSEFYPFRHILGSIYKRGTRAFPFVERAYLRALLQLDGIIGEAISQFWMDLAERYALR